MPDIPEVCYYKPRKTKKALLTGVCCESCLAVLTFQQDANSVLTCFAPVLGTPQGFTPFGVTSVGCDW